VIDEPCFSSLPVVPSKTAIVLSVTEEGPTTSPVPAAVQVPFAFKNLFAAASPDAGAGTNPFTPPDPESPLKAFKSAVACVAVKSSTFPVLAVVRPLKVPEETVASMEFVTLFDPMVAATLPGPDAVTSPVKAVI
jgi:hypothetical protein